MTKKFLIISDTHGVLPEVPEGTFDILIMPGDLAPHFNANWSYNDYFERMLDEKSEADSQHEWAKNVLSPWVNKINAKHKIILPGNHDFADYRDIFENSTFDKPKNIIIDGIKFGLLPGMVRTSGFWSDEITEDEFDRRIHELDSDTQILISHSPPKAVLDLDNGNRWGSDSIYKAVFGLRGMQPWFNKLSMHAFGHVHDSDNSEETHMIEDRKLIFINAACKVKIIDIEV